MSYEKKRLACDFGNNSYGNDSDQSSTNINQEYSEQYSAIKMNEIPYPSTLNSPSNSKIQESEEAQQCDLEESSESASPKKETNINENTTNEQQNEEILVQPDIIMKGEVIDGINDELDENCENEPIPKHCFVCNTKFPEDNEISIPLFETETSKTRRKFSVLVGKLVGRSIAIRKVSFDRNFINLI